MTKMTRPYQPVATIEQIAGYDSQKPETFTASPLLNAVLQALEVVRPMSCRNVAHYLHLRATALSAAIEVETGFTFSQFLDEFRRVRMIQLLEENPQMQEVEMIKRLGFANDTSLWKFRKRMNINTVEFAHQ